MYLVKVERVVARNRTIQSRLSIDIDNFMVEMSGINDGDDDDDIAPDSDDDDVVDYGDDDDDADARDDDGQMMASCLEERCPLCVETSGSSNISLANPSNLAVIMMMVMMMTMMMMMMSYPRKDRLAAVHIFNSSLPDQRLVRFFSFDFITTK